LADAPVSPEQAPEGKSDPDRESVESARMTFLEHLYDLRLRLRNAALWFIGLTLLSFVFFKK
jgi:hypothetical protein